MLAPVADAAGRDRKSWTTLQARAAIAGWQLWRSDPDDGPQRYFAGRWGQVRVLADLAEVEAFLQKVARQVGSDDERRLRRTEIEAP